MPVKFTRDILVVDEDYSIYEVINNCFIHDNVMVHWAKNKSQALNVKIDMNIILCATPLNGEDSYDLLADLGHRHPNAAMFMLPLDYSSYNAFNARNAGGLGAFFKPLRYASLESRLQEFLGYTTSGNLDQVSIPSRTEQIAKLISFQTSSPIVEDIEGIVREVLPVVVEQVLRIQLQNNSALREIIEREVHEALGKEIDSILLNVSNKPSDKS